MFLASAPRKSYSLKWATKSHGRDLVTRIPTSWSLPLWSPRFWTLGQWHACSSQPAPTRSSLRVSSFQSLVIHNLFWLRWTKTFRIYWQKLRRVRRCIRDWRCFDSLRRDPCRTKEKVSRLGDVPIQIRARAEGTSLHVKIDKVLQGWQHRRHWPFRVWNPHTMGGVLDYNCLTQVPACHRRDNLPKTCTICHWRLMD